MTDARSSFSERIRSGTVVWSGAIGHKIEFRVSRCIVDVSATRRTGVVDALTLCLCYSWYFVVVVV